MKKLAFAGLAAAALTLTALSGQRASAQCCPPECRRGGEISFNVGVSFGVHWTPHQGHWVPNCPPPCYGPPPYAYAPPGYGGSFAPQQGASANGAAVPNAPAAPATTSAAANGVQNVGYSYPAAYGYDYGYLYGYGYPYYQAQAPDYWYGH